MHGHLVSWLVMAISCSIVRAPMLNRLFVVPLVEREEPHTLISLLNDGLLKAANRFSLEALYPMKDSILSSEAIGLWVKSSVNTMNEV